MSPEQLLLIGSLLVVALKITCFVLGYMIVKLGYRLILSGVRGEFKFSASFGGARADLASVSPGLLFVVLGVGLIGYAISVDKPQEIGYEPLALQPIERPDGTSVMPQLQNSERSPSNDG